MENKENWIKLQLLALAGKTVELDDVHQKSMGVDYIKGALNLIPQKVKNETEWEVFQNSTSELINQFPSDVNDQPRKNTYLKNLSLYKSEIMKTYKVVAQGYYRMVWIPLGISIGLPFGLVFKNIALGIPIGLVIGIVIGFYLDSVAKKENRVI